MMKHLIITIMLLFNISLFGQVRDFNDIPKEILEQLDKMGIDNSPLLNCYESVYLNVIIKDGLNEFDFTGKKIGFIRNGGKGKIQYFDMHKKHIIDKNSPCDNGTLYIFNAEQKTESGGYDAAIVYWSKFLLPVEKIIKRLNGKR